MHDYDDYKYYIDGKVIRLGNNQNEVLNLLIENKNHLVTYKKIAQRIYFKDYKKDMVHNISLIIHKLRTECNLHIDTVRSRGYCLRGIK